MKAPLSIQKDANLERAKKTRKKTPTKTQPQQKTQSIPTKTQKPSITLHHSSPLAFAPSRTKNPSIIIDIALKVMKFSIPFNLRSGDWDLKTLPLNHLSHDIQKTLYVSLKGNPHSLGAAQRRTLPRENLQPLQKHLPSKIHTPQAAGKNGCAEEGTHTDKSWLEAP
jgi:hypothetical protein